MDFAIIETLTNALVSTEKEQGIVGFNGYNFACTLNGFEFHQRRSACREGLLLIEDDEEVKLHPLGR